MNKDGIKDITLKPFQRVLVRDGNNEVWQADLYSQYVAYAPGMQVHNTVGGYWRQCIPYEGNQALLGTTDGPKLPEPDFAFGDHVEVKDANEDWHRAVFLRMSDDNKGYYLAIEDERDGQIIAWPYCRKANW